MKIAFLLGSLEPGADGVGDYSRSLAHEIIRQSSQNSVCLLALSDPYVTSPQISTRPNGLQQLRLPASLSWAQRSDEARRFLDDFCPEVVSLQFVPYAFHPKGIVSGLPKYLRPLVKGRYVHFMFHEIWNGDGVGSSVKDRLVGNVQRHYTLSLLKALNPVVIHTTNPAYSQLLKQRGVSANILPLFGSIPILETKADQWLFPLLREQGVNITQQDRQGFWLFGFFGTFHPEWDGESLFGLIQQSAIRYSRQVVMLSAGGMGRKGLDHWNGFAKRHGKEFPFLALGRQDEKKVSEFFNSLDFGIATSPLALIGKSSCAVSMFEHGLPLIINRDDIHFRGIRSTAPAYEGTILTTRETDFPEQLLQAPRQQTASRTSRVAAQLLNDLDNTAHFLASREANKS